MQFDLFAASGTFGEFADHPEIHPQGGFAFGARQHHCPVFDRDASGTMRTFHDCADAIFRY